MVKLKQFKNRFEAEFFATILDKENIPYITQSDDSGGQKPASHSIAATILVSEKDYELAKSYLLEQ